MRYNSSKLNYRFFILEELFMQTIPDRALGASKHFKKSEFELININPRS
jgi:hypothetical protein